MEYLPLLMLAPLLKLAVSDFRRREVPVLWLGILAVGTVGISILRDGWLEVLRRSGLNLLLVLYMAAGVFLWGWVKARRPVNPLNLYIGLGDFLFFLILVPLFPLKQYAYLLVGSMLFSLAWWRAAVLLEKKPPKNIPLIATSSIVLGAFIIFDVFCE